MCLIEIFKEGRSKWEIDMAILESHEKALKFK
jgi:hypothetical protein